MSLKDTIYSDVPDVGTLEPPLSMWLLVPHEVTLAESPSAPEMQNFTWRNRAVLSPLLESLLNTRRTKALIRNLKYIWILKLQHFFGKRKSGEFNISVFYILFKTALNISDTFPI